MPQRRDAPVAGRMQAVQGILDGLVPPLPRHLVLGRRRYWPLNGDRGGQQAPSLFTTIYDAPTAQAEGLAGRARAVVPLDTWREKADAWLKARIGLLVTADDLTRDIGLPTEEDGTPTNNGIGGYIGGLARRGVLRLDHFENSTRVSSHARVFRVWLVVKAP